MVNLRMVKVIDYMIREDNNSISTLLPEMGFIYFPHYMDALTEKLLLILWIKSYISNYNIGVTVNMDILNYQKQSINQSTHTRETWFKRIGLWYRYTSLPLQVTEDMETCESANWELAFETEIIWRQCIHKNIWTSKLLLFSRTPKAILHEYHKHLTTSYM